MERAIHRTTTNGSQRSAISNIENRCVFAWAFPLLPKRRESEFPPTEKRSTLMWVFFSSIPCYFFIEKTTKIREPLRLEKSVWVHVV